MHYSVEQCSEILCIAVQYNVVQGSAVHYRAGMYTVSVPSSMYISVYCVDAIKC